jgi:sugar lactone lactonase YvrE
MITLAGSATDSGSADGTGAAARFNGPDGVAVDEAGDAFVADRHNNTIRKITPAGVVTTLAGSAAAYSGSADGTGATASFNFPCGVAVDGAGNIFVADSFNDTIRMVTPAGVVTTLAGSAGSLGSTDGAGVAARFDRPSGVAGDGAGNLFVADMGNDTIRKITPSGVVTTLAGSATEAPGSADGTGGDAHFNRPQGVAMDGAGNLFVTDTGNGTIRKVTPAGVVTTLAGTAGSWGSADGTGAAARFSTPYGVAVDRAGNVFVADVGNNAIRKITASGVVTTVVGVAAQTSVGNLPGPLPASIIGPNGVAIDSSGTMLYITLADAIMVAVLPN